MYLIAGSFNKNNVFKTSLQGYYLAVVFLYMNYFICFFLLFYLYLAYTIRIYGSFQQFCNANIRDMIFRIQNLNYSIIKQK